MQYKEFEKKQLKIALVNDPFSFIPTTVWKEQICKSNEENSGKIIPQA